MASSFFSMCWLLSGRSNHWMNSVLSRTHSMNASLTRIDMFAFVTLSRSVFTDMNSSRSGCSQDMVSMRAPRLPCWPMSPVTMENRSVNDTAPEVSEAVLFILAPLGASLDMSIPHPPP